ncbi:flagellar basal body-associated FliL family protein [Ammoniphilus resinae]|uniref:Flagellar protein FliL n=1 Tax=Ammoniphilus resinae TaxID=861532 RepID=A0ABS4GMM8_9BACL|nr:flagellar basal body-associated FliL family protein [Ammoniphilus resinae]MBP1931506.1 flagellar FliL protein [Ammoniphilus resinae]
MRKHVLLLLSAILLLATVTFIIWYWFVKPEEEPKQKPLSAEKLLESVIETQDMTTNLKSGGFIQVKFQLQADSVPAKEELSQRMFQIRHIMLQTLASKNAEDLRGEEGINHLEKNIQDKLNQLMSEGQVIKVYTTKKLLQ